MVKFVLLKQAVPSTFDGGFRAAGYETLELVDLPECPNFVPGELAQRLKMKIPEKHAIPAKQHSSK